MLLSAVTPSAEDKKDNEISLHKSALDTKQKRFASYYNSSCGMRITTTC